MTFSQAIKYLSIRFTSRTRQYFCSWNQYALRHHIWLSTCFHWLLLRWSLLCMESSRKYSFIITVPPYSIYCVIKPILSTHTTNDNSTKQLRISLVKDRHVRTTQNSFMLSILLNAINGQIKFDKTFAKELDFFCISDNFTHFLLMECWSSNTIHGMKFLVMVFRKQNGSISCLPEELRRFYFYEPGINCPK